MIELKHFNPNEFRQPDKMDEEFLMWLDNVRDTAGVPMRLTSDYRSPETNRRVGGHPASLHVLGRAVDFSTPYSRARDAQGYYAELYRIIDAVCITFRDDHAQVEFVKGPTDWHVHLGLYPEDWTGPDKLIIATD
jgi:hypothetical protein